MEVTAAKSPLSFSGIQLDPEAVALIEREKVVKKVVRSDVLSLELRRGFLSRHPFIQMAFGAVLIWLGHYPVASLIRWFREGGTTFDLVVLVTLLIPLGGWLIYDAFRRGYYLDLRSRAERLRFPFSGNPDATELGEFLATAQTELGYDIPDRT